MEHQSANGDASDASMSALTRLLLISTYSFPEEHVLLVGSFALGGVRSFTAELADYSIHMCPRIC